MTNWQMVGCGVMAVLGSILMTANAADFSALSTQYEKSKQKAVTTYEVTVLSSVALYSNDLTVAEAQFKKDGNLEALLAVREERKAFAISAEIPKVLSANLPQIIAQANLAHTARVQQAEKARDKNLVVLAKQYLAQLDVMKKQLTAQDKIDDALQVQTEMKKIETQLALLPLSSPELDKQHSTNAAPTVTVISFEEFKRLYNETFPPAKNQSKGGRVSTSSPAWADASPSSTLQGKRCDAGFVWSFRDPGIPGCWYQVEWSSPKTGRCILLFSREKGAGSDAWGRTTLQIDDKKEVQIEGVDSGQVVIVDLGKKSPVRKLRLTFNPPSRSRPGLTGVEIQPEDTTNK